jgi:hypothetical protein
MLPFIDDEPIGRLDTTLEIVIPPDAAPDTVRADLLERIASSVATAIGRACPDGRIVATVVVKLAIHLVAAEDSAHAILPISIRFDPVDDHGEGTTGWAPDVLLRAVIRNEVERIWRHHLADELIGCAFGMDVRTMSLAA